MDQWFTASVTQSFELCHDFLPLVAYFNMVQAG
jgi:hypothetical protein